MQLGISCRLEGSTLNENDIDEFSDIILAEFVMYVGLLPNFNVGKEVTMYSSQKMLSFYCIAPNCVFKFFDRSQVFQRVFSRLKTDANHKSKLSYVKIVKLVNFWRFGIFPALS